MRIADILKTFLEVHTEKCFPVEQRDSHALSFMTGYSAAIKQLERDGADTTIKEYYEFRDQAAQVFGRPITPYIE